MRGPLYMLKSYTEQSSKEPIQFLQQSMEQIYLHPERVYMCRYKADLPGIKTRRCNTKQTL